MTSSKHLIIDKGADVGREIVVPPEGARLGRSSKNDIVLHDPVLSRHHCRLFFNAQGALCVSDLGSANQTLVNGKPVQEAKLNLGDVVTAGDTLLRVLNNGVSSPPPVDLGLSDKTRPAPRAREFRPSHVILLALLGVVLLALVWVSKRLPDLTPKAPLPPVGEETSPSLVVAYEKVEATPQNIFRYTLEIAQNGLLSVKIDDIENDRHVREEKQLDPEYVRSLALSIMDSGFFSLSPEYHGIQPELLDLRDLEITIGRKTLRCTVANRVEPDIFRIVRETIEECGKNELGLWAIQFSPQKLVSMANEAYLQGRKLFEEREIAYANLASAIQNLEEAEWYLETVEPKPDFYPAAISALSECKQVLDEKYNDQIFRAERSIKLGDWDAAAVELRILLELVPERSDPRNRKARKKLLDVEQRLGRKR